MRCAWGLELLNLRYIFAMNTHPSVHDSEQTDCGFRISDHPSGGARGLRIEPRQSEIRFPKSLCALIGVLIVLVAARVSEGKTADSVSVFHCTFGDDWDVNYDRWPDPWVRRSGIEYPHYVEIAIEDNESAPNKRCLTIDLDGAAAAIASPPIPVMSRFSYVFQAQLKSEGLKHSTVMVTLDFCDAN